MKPGRFKYKHAKLTLPLLLCALPPCQSVPQEREKLIFDFQKWKATYANRSQPQNYSLAQKPNSRRLIVRNTWLFFVHTDANPCWNRGQRDPEGNPGEDNQQAGGDICLQDKVENAPLQLKMEDQLRIIAFEKDVA